MTLLPCSRATFLPRALPAATPAAAVRPASAVGTPELIPGRGRLNPQVAAERQERRNAAECHSDDHREQDDLDQVARGQADVVVEVLLQVIEQQRLHPDEQYGR